MAAQGDAGGKAKTMREIPALFNGAMVRAIIKDRKTQTRRIVKPQPVGAVCAQRIIYSNHAKDIGKFAFFDREDVAAARVVAHARSPLGKPGDRLWVREAHAWVDYLAGSELEDPVCVAFAAENIAFSFAGTKPAQLDTYGWPWDRIKYRPSIHMPRWAARLFLDVLDVRIERLRDISEEDAQAEGVERCGGFMTTWGCWMNYGKSGPSCKTARESFQTLWISVYGAESWAANPWVWVTEFKRVT